MFTTGNQDDEDEAPRLFVTRAEGKRTNTVNSYLVIMSGYYLSEKTPRVHTYTHTYICCRISLLLFTQVDEDVLLGESASINEPASCWDQRICTGRRVGCAGRTAGSRLISPGWAGAGVRVSLPVQRCKRAVHVVGGLRMAKSSNKEWLDLTGLCWSF